MKHYIYLLAVLLIAVQGCGKVNSDDPGLLYSIGDTSVQDLGRANGVYYNGVKVVDIKLAYRTHGTVKVGPNKGDTSETIYFSIDGSTDFHGAFFYYPEVKNTNAAARITLLERATGEKSQVIMIAERELNGQHYEPISADASDFNFSNDFHDSNLKGFRVYVNPKDDKDGSMLLNISFKVKSSGTQIDLIYSGALKGM